MRAIGKLILVLLSLLITAGQTSWSQPTTDSRTRLKVFPRSAEHLQPIELPEFIASIVPEHAFGGMTWDYLSNGPIVWITNGYERNKAETYRRGMVRIRVQGVPSTTLRQQREELAWTLSLVTNDPPKFGPRFLRLEIGFPDAVNCFGDLDEGCAFTPSQALESSRIISNLLCPFHFNGNPGVYEIRVDKKEPVLLAYFNSGGSGGSISEIEIHPFENREALCSKK
jgi:hypothetical protein